MKAVARAASQAGGLTGSLIFACCGAINLAVQQRRGCQDFRGDGHSLIQRRGSYGPAWVSIRQVGITRSFLQESEEGAPHLRGAGNDVPTRMPQDQGILEEAREALGAAAWDYEIRVAEDVK